MGRKLNRKIEAAAAASVIAWPHDLQFVIARIHLSELYLHSQREMRFQQLYVTLPLFEGTELPGSEAIWVLIRRQ
jgi:hypothetical protein